MQKKLHDFYSKNRVYYIANMQSSQAVSIFTVKRGLRNPQKSIKKGGVHIIRLPPVGIVGAGAQVVHDVGDINNTREKASRAPPKKIMKTTHTADALKQALLIAAGDAATSPVLTTEAYIKMQTCFWANLVDMLDAWRHTPGSGVQVYGLASEYAKRVGRSLNTIKDWLRQLEAMGMIHPIEGAPSRPGAVGDTLYNFVEVDNALREIRQQRLAKKSI